MASLLAAVDDRKLLGAAFVPHPRQRELLEVIGRSRIVVAAAGRRFGKSRAAAAAALHNLLCVPELDSLVSAGERRHALCVATSQQQAGIFLEHARSIVMASPALMRELVSATVSELEFRGGRVLSAFPCTSRSSRGYAASFVCLDEFAHHFDAEEGGPATAQRIWAATTPSLAQFGDLGRLVVISTPLADGLFAELYAKARNGEIDGAEAFHAPTSDSPLIDAGYLEAQAVALGHDDFAREYGAEFVTGGSSFLEPSRIRDVVCDWREALPSDGEGWLLAFDPSFSRDPAAAAVVGRSPFDRSKLVVGHVQRWLPEKRRLRVRRSREDETQAIRAVLDDVAALAARFQVSRVVTDQHMPATVVDELGKRGVYATVRAWTRESRTAAFQAVRARVNTGRIELPDSTQLVTELSRIRSKITGGAASVEIPKVGDSHCDLAVAVALGVAELDHFGIDSGPVWSPASDRAAASIVSRRVLDSVTSSPAPVSREWRSEASRDGEEWTADLWDQVF